MSLPQPTTLLFVRHGQARGAGAAYNRETGLSQLGQLQAAATAEALLTAGTSLEAVYTSPFLRALQTALPLCERLGLHAVVEPRITEFEVGSFTLETAAQRPDLVVWQADHRGLENGETLGEFAARVAAFCDEAVERHPGKHLAVITHAGVIDAAVRWAVGLAPYSSWQHELDLPNGSISEVRFWPRGRTKGGAPRYAFIRKIGAVTHLAGLASDL